MIICTASSAGRAFVCCSRPSVEQVTESPQAPAELSTDKSTWIRDTIMIIRCDSCKSEREVKPTPKGNARPPRGWRIIPQAPVGLTQAPVGLSNTSSTSRLTKNILCKKCFAESYCTVAVTIPVIGTKEAWKIIKPQWYETTALSNWVLDNIIKHEKIRTPDQEKLSKKPKIYLYGEARDNYPRFGILPSSASLSVINRVERDWNTDRYNVMWSYKQSRRVYKYAQPYTISDFKIVQDENGIKISARIGDDNHTLSLSNSKGFYHQRRRLRNIIKYTELTLYRRKANDGDHRSFEVERTNGQPIKRRYRIYAKICVVVRKESAIDKNGIIGVRTTKDSLVAAFDSKNKRIWWYNADHARRIVVKHEKHLLRLQRLSEDTKHERRKPKRDGACYREMISNVSKKDVRRIQQIADEVAKSVVEFAYRRKYNGIVYDDRERSFANNFRWSILKEKIKSKCNMRGLKFEYLQEKE